MMAMSGNKLKLTRIKLWHNQDGDCYWCKKPTQLTHWPADAGQPPDDLATTDHLIHRLNPLRGTNAEKGDVRYVMACYRCNQERGAEEERGWKRFRQRSKDSEHAFMRVLVEKANRRAE